MFKTLSSLTKAVVGTVTLPINILTDVATLGGALTDKDKPYTAEALSQILTNLEDATKDENV